ncbi:unnamed protein product [Acanthoscelides obtectus]|uniref:Uncharacterized protein n=1 Tax=Acanthoscelides obtectus TaxID=200917 RepID=A0A9P0MB52_ACAOB|nr:unnamed protein product [Acanthoscelides obtectus]CAK1638462.1 hypothetical protein AOBTE_LOCUS10617 [Acanthoscelides obtectus]
MEHKFWLRLRPRTDRDSNVSEGTCGYRFGGVRIGVYGASQHKPTEITSYHQI